MGVHVSSVLTLDPRNIKKLEVKVERRRQGKNLEMEIPINLDKTWPLEDRGWMLAAETRPRQGDQPVDAIEMGFTDTITA